MTTLSEQSCIKVGSRVRVKGHVDAALVYLTTGVVLSIDPWTYLCQVAWDSPHGGGQATVHRMYLECSS